MDGIARWKPEPQGGGGSLDWKVVRCGAQVYAAATEEVGESEDAVASAKLRIKLKAYNVPAIKEAEQQILDAAAATGATVSGPVHMPTRIRRWCVLRSPHVNKVWAVL